MAIMLALNLVAKSIMGAGVFNNFLMFMEADISFDNANYTFEDINIFDI